MSIKTKSTRSFFALLMLSIFCAASPPSVAVADSQAITCEQCVTNYNNNRALCLQNFELDVLDCDIQYFACRDSCFWIGLMCYAQCTEDQTACYQIAIQGNNMCKQSAEAGYKACLKICVTPAN
jgi:hypothetical protein